MNPNRPESLVVVSVVRSAWSLGAVCPITLAPPIGSPSVPRTIPEMMADCAPAVAGASQARADTSNSTVRRGPPSGDLIRAEHADAHSEP